MCRNYSPSKMHQDIMARVQRLSRTEKVVRSLDATDIAEWIQALEDERDALAARISDAEVQVPDVKA